MGDRTAFQVYVYDCPEDQREAVAKILAEMSSEEAENVPAFKVVDETRTSDGKPITRRYMGDPLTVATYPKLEQAEAHVARLPEGEDRYSIEEIEWPAIGERYMDPEMSCGSADEYAGNLMEAAPGASFVLWEDPAYQWLGDLRAYAPDLGLFAAQCDADGNPTLMPGQIREAVAAAQDAVRAALAARHECTEEEAVIDAVLAEIDKATGKAWLDRFFPPGEPHLA